MTFAEHRLASQQLATPELRYSHDVVEHDVQQALDVRRQGKRAGSVEVQRRTVEK